MEAGKGRATNNHCRLEGSSNRADLYTATRELLLLGVLDCVCAVAPSNAPSQSLEFRLQCLVMVLVDVHRSSICSC